MAQRARKLKRIGPPIQWGRENPWPGDPVMQDPMDKAELTMLMHRLGDAGASELAKRLRVDRSTAWRWISGETPMGAAYAALYRLMAERKAGNVSLTRET